MKHTSSRLTVKIEHKKVPNRAPIKPTKPLKTGIALREFGKKKVRINSYADRITFDNKATYDAMT